MTLACKWIAIVLYHARILYHMRMVRSIRVYAYGTVDFFVRLNIAYPVSVCIVPFTNGIRNTQHGIHQGIRDKQCSNGPQYDHTHMVRNIISTIHVWYGIFYHTCMVAITFPTKLAITYRRQPSNTTNNSHLIIQ